jgi:hypothetical protein
MSGIMVGAACMSNDSIANFTVNPVGQGFSTGVSNSFTFYGYAASGAVVTGTGPNAANYPNATFGTATPGTINGATIIGVYSIYIDPASTGVTYNVIVAGDWTALPNTINTLSIGGTSVSAGATKSVVLGPGTTTRFTFTLASAIASVFLPNGGSKQVIIT